MRIIAGTLKHRIIPSPPGDATRPTSDRGRETLFHVLEQNTAIATATVLDLYAGSGALAFEALSRGATSATLVDASADVCRHLRSTAVALGVSDLVRIVRADVLQYLQEGTPDETDIVFVDPPYVLKSCNAVVSRLLGQNVLANGGIVALEHSDQEHVLAHEELLHVRTIEIGTTLFDVYRRVGPLP